ncbi:MAG: molecular chaperone DnaJ [Rhodothalassiaceae bacterium]
MQQDYYDVLGVARDADAKTLKAAYRKLAMQYHPDRNPGDAAAEQKFKAVNQAYDVLKDDQKRAAYDRFGHAAFEGGMAGAGAHGRAAGFDFADIFNEFFGDMAGGRGARRRGAARGADLRYDLELTLEEAHQGKKMTLDIPTTVACESCNGSGARAGSTPEVCSTCGGIGKVRAQQGFFMVERTCPACRGAGTVITDPCPDCGGAGRREKEKSLSVNIPAGVDDGTRIRLAGEGEAGARGGPPGDLYIFVSIVPHPLFRREAATLFCTVPVAMTTAILGGEVEVPTIDGKRAKVKIPEGTQSGRQFRLRQKGMTQLNTGLRGDMIIEAHVETPVNLTKKQRDLMAQFAREGGDTISPRSSSFFDKVKEVWEDLTE